MNEAKVSEVDRKLDLLFETIREFVESQRSIQPLEPISDSCDKLERRLSNLEHFMQNIAKTQKQQLQMSLKTQSHERRLVPLHQTIVDTQTGGHKVYRSYAQSIPITSMACFKKIGILMDKHNLHTLKREDIKLIIRDVESNTDKHLHEMVLKRRKSLLLGKRLSNNDRNLKRGGPQKNKKSEAVKKPVKFSIFGCSKPKITPPPTAKLPMPLKQVTAQHQSNPGAYKFKTQLAPRQRELEGRIGRQR